MGCKGMLRVSASIGPPILLSMLRGGLHLSTCELENADFSRNQAAWCKSITRPILVIGAFWLTLLYISLSFSSPKYEFCPHCKHVAPSRSAWRTNDILKRIAWSVHVPSTRPRASRFSGILSRNSSKPRLNTYPVQGGSRPWPDENMS